MKQNYYATVGNNVRKKIVTPEISLPIITIDTTDKPETVKVIQAILKMRGYKRPDKKVLSINGLIDPDTIQAIYTFKNDNNITETDLVGVQTWLKLIN